MYKAWDMAECIHLNVRPNQHHEPKEDGAPENPYVQRKKEMY